MNMKYQTYFLKEGKSWKTWTRDTALVTFNITNTINNSTKIRLASRYSINKYILIKNC